MVVRIQDLQYSTVTRIVDPCRPVDKVNILGY